MSSNSDATFARMEADRLLKTELQKTQQMFGHPLERSDTSKGELMGAAMAQVTGIAYKGLNGHFPETPPETWPETWGGFRDYGSDVANLVVAATFLHNEIIRRLAKGESSYRRPRGEQDAPFTIPHDPVN